MSTEVNQDLYDICIIGGGVYGAWAARDAALRGLKVILVEKGDWGCATSQSSSKLLHGGLRYLEQYEFGLVRKSLKERDVLFEIIQNLVKPLRFVVPLYKSSRVGPFKMRLGLKVYDQLAGESEIAKPYKRLSDEDVFALFPWLERNEFKAALEYSDAQTDDARLTYQIIECAKRLGVTCLSYTEATITHTMQSDKEVQLNKQGEIKKIKSRSILMTTGPWKDANIGSSSKTREKSKLTKGVHLILPDIGIDRAFTLFAPEDGRVFFLIPWYGRTMVGTTDTNYQGRVEDCKVNKNDVDYILKAVNNFLGSTQWSHSDVIGSFCGLRVLQAADDENPSQASREWALPEIRPAIFRSIGGKLTSAREDAAKAIDHIVECMNFSVKPSGSHTQSLYDVDTSLSDWTKTIDEMSQTLDLDKSILDNLIFRYGPHAEKVMSLMLSEKKLSKKIVSELPFVWAEIDYICLHEEFYTLEDLVRRRMPLMILTRYSESLLSDIVDRVRIYKNWSDENVEQEKQVLMKKWKPI